MKKNILLLAMAAGIFASCGTLKTSQTTDDVYYSAERVIQVDETEEKKDKKEYNYEDRALRMRTEDGARWNTLQNPDYYSTYRYDYNCNCNCNQYGNYYGNRSNIIWGNNYYGNNIGWYPNNFSNYVAVIPQTSPKYIAPKGGAIFNGSRGYRNTTYNNNNSSTNNKTGNGIVNRVFGNSSSSESSPRAYTPSSSSSSSSSSSGSSSSGASRPARSGN